MKTIPFLIVTCISLLFASLADAQKIHAFIWNSGSGMMDLGTLGGDISYATGVNDSGEVVGRAYLADNVTYHTFTWTAAGGMVDIGTLPGGAWSHGEAINAAGSIAGEAANPSGQVPFFWSSSTGFATLNQAGSVNYAFDINDSNYVTGQLYDQAFVWAPRYSEPILLGHLLGGSLSAGYGINNRQRITGTANVADGTWHAFVWSRSSGMIDIGAVPGGSYTSGRAINSRNQVAGFGGTPYSAFYWTQSGGLVTMQGLGGGATLAIDMNEAGSITGYSSIASGPTHAALWSNHTSAPQDLGTLPGGINSYGYSINNVGQVVGYADVP
jgi:probable HAF family extracellular repeat protein